MEFAHYKSAQQYFKIFINSFKINSNKPLHINIILGENKNNFSPKEMIKGIILFLEIFLIEDI